MLRRIVRPMLNFRVGKCVFRFPQQISRFNMNLNHISLSNKQIYQFCQEDQDDRVVGIIQDLQAEIEDAEEEEQVQRLIDLIDFLSDYEAKNEELDFELKITFYNSIIALGDLYQQIYTFDKQQMYIIDNDFLEEMVNKIEPLQHFNYKEHTILIQIIKNRLKQFEIINKMIVNSNTMSIETFHESINDVLDLIELIGGHMKNFNRRQDIKFQDLQFCKFYFFVSEIFSERGDFEEQERFLDYSFDSLFKVLEEKDPLLLNDLKGGIIISIILLSNRVIHILSPPVVEKYFNNLFKAFDLIGDENLILNVKPFECLLLCNYYIAHDLEDKAFEILNYINSQGNYIHNPELQFMYLTTQCFLFEGKKRYEKKLESIIKKLDKFDLETIEDQECFLYGLKYHRIQFIKEMKNKQFKKIETRLKNIFWFTDRLNATFKEDSDPSFLLLMFRIVDEIVQAKKLPERIIYLTQLYKLFTDFQFVTMRDQNQEFQKQFYFVSLSFIMSEWIPFIIEQGFQALELFIDNYKKNEKFSEQFFMKLLDLHYYILGEKHIIQILQNKDPKIHKEKFDHVRNTLRKIIELLQTSKANIDKDQLIQLFQSQLQMVDDKEKLPIQ